MQPCTNDYIATALLLSFDYHLRVCERFEASHLITDNLTKLERSIESIIRIIYASLSGEIEFVSSRETSAATTLKIANVSEISKYIFSHDYATSLDLKS